MKNIALVGFMGTGKTAVGKVLAGKLGRPFVDLDALIIQREKRPIAEIFAKEGEPYFRKVESEILAGVAGKDAQVIACGGGVVLAKENWKHLRKNSIIVCLTATPNIILKRVQNETHRPLMNVTDPRTRIEELLLKRAPLYAKADHTIDTSDLSVPQVVETILDALDIPS